MQNNCNINFNVVGSLADCFNLPATTPNVKDNIEYYVDAYFGNDELGDGTPEKPFKTLYKVYTVADPANLQYYELPNIVIRGNFEIGFVDRNVVWVGDDENCSITYTQPNYNKSAKYINLKVFNFTKGALATRSFKSSFRGERDDSTNTFDKGYYGVFDLRDKPITENLGGYHYSLVIGGRENGGNYNSFIASTVNTSVNGSDNVIYFADNKIFKDTDYSFENVRGNFESDFAFGQYINSQLNVNTFNQNNNIILRYTLDEIFNVDLDNLTAVFTDFGYDYIKKNYPNWLFFPKVKNIPIYDNSDGHINCWDSSSAQGNISVENNSIYIDEESEMKTGSITSKVIKMNRVTENIVGLISSLRYLETLMTDSLGLKTLPSYASSYDYLYIGSNERKDILEGNSNLGVYVLKGNNSVNLKIGNSKTYSSGDYVIYPGDVISFQANDWVRNLENEAIKLYNIYAPNPNVGFLIRGTNELDSIITSGTLENYSTYIALETTTVSIDDNLRTLTEGESIDTKNQSIIVNSGKLGMVFGQMASSDYTYYDYEQQKPITILAKSPWIPIESNCSDFGIGKDENGTVFLNRVVTSVNKLVNSYSVRNIKAIGDNRSAPLYSKGFSYKYIQISLNVNLTPLKDR